MRTLMSLLRSDSPSKIAIGKRLPAALASLGNLPQHIRLCGRGAIPQNFPL